MKTILFLILFPALFAFTVINLNPVDTPDAVTFVIKNFGINTKGELKGLKGSIKWDQDNPANSSFSVSVDVNTLNTGIEMRDKDLKKDEYFDAEKHPTINFSSSAVSATDLTGDLTIKGITKRITFPYTVAPSGNGYLFQGNFTINRRDFDVGGSSMVLSDKVNVSLKVQANPQ